MRMEFSLKKIKGFKNLWRVDLWKFEDLSKKFLDQVSGLNNVADPLLETIWFRAVDYTDMKYKYMVEPEVRFVFVCRLSSFIISENKTEQFQIGEITAWLQQSLEWLHLIFGQGCPKIRGSKKVHHFGCLKIKVSEIVLRSL